MWDIWQKSSRHHLVLRFVGSPARCLQKTWHIIGVIPDKQTLHLKSVICQSDRLAGQNIRLRITSSFSTACVDSHRNWKDYGRDAVLWEQLLLCDVTWQHRLCWERECARAAVRPAVCVIYQHMFGEAAWRRDRRGENVVLWRVNVSHRHCSHLWSTTRESN